MNAATMRLPTREDWLEEQRQQTLSHYTPRQCGAALQLFQLVNRHWSTSGATAAAKLLLGIYNGRRFPFDLTDLRSFDDSNYAAAMVVLDMDARHTWCEIHVLLDAVRGAGDTQAQMECWAYDLRLKGRCTKEGYLEMCARAGQAPG